MTKVLITIMVSVSGFVLGGDFIHPTTTNADSSKTGKRENASIYHQLTKPFNDIKKTNLQQQEISTIKKLDKIIENLKKENKQTVKSESVTQRR